MTERITITTEKKKTTKRKIAKVIKSRLKNKINIIAIHGASTSGKTTFAKNLYNTLKDKKPCYIVHMDNYYKTFQGTDFTKYDFDNPAALDWDKLHETLQAINDEKPFVPTYSYSFNTKISSGPVMDPNNFPKIVIIEGIYALNLFNKTVFDTDVFDPYDPSKEGYKKNNITYKNFNILRIRLCICKNRMKHTRIQRDILERNRSYLFAMQQFKNQVWPATSRWVYSSEFKSNIDLVHGSFNLYSYKTLFKRITDHLIGSSLYLFEKESDIKTVDCSKECMHRNKSDLMLYDNVKKLWKK